MDQEIPIQAPEAPRPLMPWEDRERFPSLGSRALATIGLILGRPDEAGPALAAGTVGPAIAFCALLALPAQWITQAVVQLSGASQAMQTEAVAFLHLPAMPEPTAEQLAMQRIVAWVAVAVFPLTFAVGMLVVGALMHAGLWMVRAAARGIEVTFRTVLYANGALSWMSLIITLGVLLPGPVRWITQLIGLAVGLGFFTYQGILLAKAHGVETWRGIVGVFLPVLILGLCICCCVAMLAGGAAAAAGALH
ncbi:MAG TPA: hypothetical protein VJ483_04360 [Holophagaceae bacterium]|nr:hypothetical protein [Holophagaceae bacterium]